MTAKCWCGCGKSVARRFKPGHDARFHSRVQQVADGNLQISKAMPKRMPPEAKKAFREQVKSA